MPRNRLSFLVVSRKKGKTLLVHKLKDWDSTHLPRKPWSLPKRVSFLEYSPPTRLCHGALPRVGVRKAEAPGGRSEKGCWGFKAVLESAEKRKAGKKKSSFEQ